MTRPIRLGLLPVLLVLLLAATCDRLFYARLARESTPDQPVFLLGGGPDLSGHALVYRIAVSGRMRTGGLTSPWHTYWEVEKDSALRYVGVTRVEYAVVPEHMHLVAGPESLTSGMVFAFTPGCHGLSPRVYFEINADSSGKKAIHELTEDRFLAIIHDTLP